MTSEFDIFKPYMAGETELEKKNKEGFSVHRRFCDYFSELAMSEYKEQMKFHDNYFTHQGEDKKAEYLTAHFPQMHTHHDFLETTKFGKLPACYLAFFANIFDKCIQETFNKIPADTYTLPWLTSEDTCESSSKKDSQLQIQHQSESILPNQDDDQEMEIEKIDNVNPSTNRKNKKKVLEKKKDTSSSDKQSHDQTSSQKPKTKRNKNQRPGPRSIKILTGYQGQDKERIKDILIYDIPSNWTDEDILNHLQSWGKTLQICSKIQRKYQTLRVKIELNDSPYNSFMSGDWMVALGGIPVRWFPGNYTLKERKQRECFVSVMNNIPDSLTNNALYLGTSSNAFLKTAGVKAIKIIKNPDGTRKMLGYYESFDKQKEMLETQQNWGSAFLKWELQGPFGKNKKNTRQNSKGSAFTKNKKNSNQNLNSKPKKTKPAKKGNKSITPAKKKELTKVLVEILNSIF